MGTIDVDAVSRIASHLRELRAARGLGLNELAEASGVSRASLSRIENAEVSPTVETLGRLASAFELPLSQLLAPLEPGFPALLRRDEQSVWTDGARGFGRRSLSPPSAALKIEMIECSIEAYQRIAYDKPAFPGHEHHLVMLEGTLTVGVDGTEHVLRAGDCLRYRLHGASFFETDETPARYILAMI